MTVVVSVPIILIVVGAALSIVSLLTIKEGHGFIPIPEIGCLNVIGIVVGAVMVVLGVGIVLGGVL